MVIAGMIIILISTVILLIGALESDQQWLAFLFFPIIIGMILFGAGEETQSYKEGFIDCKLGKETYTLQQQPDSTRLWIKNKMEN